MSDHPALITIRRNMQHMKWEGNLQIGQTVQARWTNSGGYYQCQGIVTKINNSSVRVSLINPPYQMAAKDNNIPFPRIAARTWSGSNGVFPVNEAEYDR